jgi:hypothetical protein
VQIGNRLPLKLRPGKQFRFPLVEINELTSTKMLC